MQYRRRRGYPAITLPRAAVPVLIDLLRELARARARALTRVFVTGNIILCTTMHGTIRATATSAKLVRNGAAAVSVPRACAHVAYREKKAHRRRVRCAVVAPPPLPPSPLQDDDECLSSSSSPYGL